MLEEIAAKSDGKHPAAASSTRSRSPRRRIAPSAFGLQAVPVGQRRRDAVLRPRRHQFHRRRRRSIPFFQPDKEAFLEYDIAKLLHSLADHRPSRWSACSAASRMAPGFDPATRQMRPGAAIFDLAQRAVRRAPARTRRRPRRSTRRSRRLVLVHPKDCSRGHAVRDRPVRAARRQPARLRRPERRDRRGGQRSRRPAGGDVRQPQLGPARAVQGLGRGVRPGAACCSTPSTRCRCSRPSGQPVRHLAILGFDAKAMNQDDVITAQLGQRQRLHRRRHSAWRRRRRWRSSR